MKIGASCPHQPFLPGFSSGTGALTVAIASTNTQSQAIDTSGQATITVDSATQNVLVNNHAIDLGGGTFLHASAVASISVQIRPTATRRSI